MKTVFFDVDTQLDFLFPAGSLYVPGAEDLIPVLARLTQYAKTNCIPVLSTVDAHSEDDPEFTVWPPHCVAGTVGQKKAAATLASAQPPALSTYARASLPTGQPQIIVEKQHIDCFTNPNLTPLLNQIAAERYVVYGLVSEICVRGALTGLLKTKARVELVTDAIRHLDAQAYRETVDEFTAGGGVLTGASLVIA